MKLTVKPLVHGTKPKGDNQSTLDVSKLRFSKTRQSVTHVVPDPGEYQLTITNTTPVRSPSGFSLVVHAAVPAIDAEGKPTTAAIDLGAMLIESPSYPDLAERSREQFVAFAAAAGKELADEYSFAQLEEALIGASARVELDLRRDPKSGRDVSTLAAVTGSVEGDGRTKAAASK